jgi:tetratricopeptide (TPR) repeat protein
VLAAKPDMTSLNANIAICYFNKAVIAFNEKKYEEAIDYYKKVIEHNPDLKEAYSNISKAYTVIGNKEEAKIWENKGKKSK